MSDKITLHGHTHQPIPTHIPYHTPVSPTTIPPPPRVCFPLPRVFLHSFGFSLTRFLRIFVSFVTLFVVRWYGQYRSSSPKCKLPTNYPPPTLPTPHHHHIHPYHVFCPSFLILYIHILYPILSYTILGFSPPPSPSSLPRLRVIAAREPQSPPR